MPQHTWKQVRDGEEWFEYEKMTADPEETRGGFPDAERSVVEGTVTPDGYWLVNAFVEDPHAKPVASTGLGTFKRKSEAKRRAQEFMRDNPDGIDWNPVRNTIEVR